MEADKFLANHGWLRSRHIELNINLFTLFMKPAVRKFYNFARSLQSRYRRQKLLCHCVFHPLLTMSEVLPPKVSGEFIAKNAKHVKIHDGGIRKLAEEASTLDCSLYFRSFR